MYTDSVTRFNFICSYLNFRILCYQPYLAHIQGHASCQIIHRLFVCPVFKNLTKAKKEHYGRSCTEVTSEHGYTDRRCIQYRNFNSAFCKCTDTLPDVFHRFKCGKECTDRKRKENFLSIMEYHMVDHFFPVFPVHFSSGILKIALRCLCLFIRKSLHCFQDFFSASPKADHSILVSFHDLCSYYSLKICQKIFKLICLSAGHSFLTNMKPDSASDLMFYFKSHIIITFSYKNTCSA